MVMVARQRNARRRGAVAVEAALVFPVLLLVTFGAIRYGWFFIKLQQITNAARCGARAAVVVDARHSDVVDAIKLLLGPYGAKIIAEGEDPPATFKVNGAVTDDVSTATGYSMEDPDKMPDQITVTISVPAAEVDILPMRLFSFEPEGWTLGASVTMAKEGY
jgi:Flp pilus assembly protein TadG